jgi:nuclear cap-binding protein subunit 1
MIVIVFDKLMQYQFVDPSDVVHWTFANQVTFGGTFASGGGARASAALGLFEWDLLKGALDEANGQVMIAKKKVQALKKEEDDTRANVQSGGADNSMEVDDDAKEGAFVFYLVLTQLEANVWIPEAVPAVDNPVLTTALKAFTSLAREQKGALSRALDGFVTCLAPPLSGRAICYASSHHGEGLAQSGELG